MEKKPVKKLLVIEGSPRENGFTNRLVKDALSDTDNVEIKYFNPYKEKFEFCIGCGYCEENGKCVFRDLDSFFEDFENADAVIFSSPVYNGGFTAPVKAVIDRFQVYFNSFYKNGKVQTIKKHRKALLVSACGRNGETALSHMENVLKQAFTVMNTEFIGSAMCSYTDTAPDYDNALEKCKLLIKRSLSDE